MSVRRPNVTPTRMRGVEVILELAEAYLPELDPDDEHDAADLEVYEEGRQYLQDLLRWHRDQRRQAAERAERRAAGLTIELVEGD